MYLYKYDKPRKEKNTGSLVTAERYNFGMKVMRRNKATYYVFDWV